MSVELASRLLLSKLASRDELRVILAASASDDLSMVEFCWRGGGELWRVVKRELEAWPGPFDKQIQVDSSAMARLPAGLCRRLLAVPATGHTPDKRQLVGLADPWDSHSVTELAFHLDMAVAPIRVPVERLLEVLRPKVAGTDDATTFGQGSGREPTPPFGTLVRPGVLPAAPPRVPSNIPLALSVPVATDRQGERAGRPSFTMPPPRPAFARSPSVPPVAARSADAGDLLRHRVPADTQPVQAHGHSLVEVPDLVPSPPSPKTESRPPSHSSLPVPASNLSANEIGAVGGTLLPPDPVLGDHPFFELVRKEQVPNSSHNPSYRSQPGSRPRRTESSLRDGAVEKMRAARSLDGLLDALMSELAEVAGVVSCFTVRGSRFVLSRSTEPSAPIGKSVVSDVASLLRTACLAGYFLGRLPNMPTLEPIFDGMAILSSDEVYVVPVEVAKRPVLVLVAARWTNAFTSTRRIDRLAVEAGEALERIVRARRQR